MTSSCLGETHYFSLMQEVKADGWSRRDGLFYELPVQDSLSLYHIDIVGRLRYNYAPDSLSLLLRVEAPSGEWFCDTIHFGLLHAHDRLWEDFRFDYCSHLCFTQKGIWRFELRHNANADILKGVSAIGFYINKEKNGKK